MGKIENGRFRAYDGIFLNTSAVVIEYHDIIKAPWYSLLQVARMSKSMFILEKMKPLIHTSNEELFEWYVNREHRNFLEDLFPSYVTKEQALTTLNDLMKDPAPWFLPSMLNFGETLKLMYDSKIVKSNDIYVYAEYDNEYIIIDYKLKNIENEAYKNQLNGYKKYIQDMTGKTVKVYLYSFIDSNLVSIS